MTLHREGTTIMLTSLAICLVLGLLNGLYLFPISSIIGSFVFALLSIMLVLVIQFFRIPKRENTYQENEITCPADGKVVVIEDTTETEYFKDKRIQVSIFMSPLNNRRRLSVLISTPEVIVYYDLLIETAHSGLRMLCPTIILAVINVPILLGS